jgi:hypothetical protein
MFGTIRKHQTWLWAIIITLTIISFVIFFSPYSKLNPGGGEGRLGSIGGKEISREQYIQAQRDAVLQYFFMSGGRWPDDNDRRSGFDPERETYQWMLLLRKAEDMGIHVSDEMVVDVARNMLSGFQRAGIGNAQEFAARILQPRGYRLADFERFVRNYLSIQHLVATFGAPGKLVTPAEAKELYVRENQELATEAVFFSPSDYLSKVTVTPEAISHYYTNHLAEYRLPERVQVKYVEFNLTNYLDMARTELSKTNLDAQVNDYMQQMGTNYLRFGTNIDQARARIREEIIRNRALVEARRKAADFATVVFEKQPIQLQNLESEAQAKGLAVKVSAPFSSRETPEGLAVGENFTTAAYGLGNTTNDFFGGPIVGETGVYVLAFDKRLPSEVPPLEQVKARVTEDFKMEQARGMANAAGMMFHRTLTNGIAQGKTFAAMAKEGTYSPVTLPPFSLGTRSLPELGGRITINELKQIAFSLQPGQVSNYQPTSEGGAIILVSAKLPINAAKLEADMPNFLRIVRQNRQTEAFNEWFRKEASVGLRDTPLATPRNAPAPDMTSGGTGKS